MKIKLKESDIQRQIMGYLQCVPNIVPVCWRQNTGAVLIKGKPRDRFIRFGQKGISDILGVMSDGRFLAIEVKTPARRKQVSIWQKDFIDRVNKAGGFAFVATSLEEVELKLMNERSQE